MPSVDEITSPEPRLSGLRDREPLVGHESGESSDGAGGGSERRCHNDDAASRARTLSGLSLVSILYFSVAGGPEGTETMIQTGGPLATLVGICLLGVVFAVPISLMTAELSTMFPENGGFVLWAKAAFGGRAGNMAGWLQFCCSAVDTALYPSLFLTYIEQTAGEQTSGEVKAIVKAAFFIALTLLNIGGIDSVGHGSSAMMIFLLFPFFLISMIGITGAIGGGTTVTGWDFNAKNWLATIPSPDWSQFVLVLIWNMGMWETASVCSGEIHDPATTFPPALAATVVLVILNYCLPIMAFVGLNAEYSKYINGYYVTIIGEVGGPFWSTWLGVSQCVSAAGLFTNGIVKNAFMLCGMGEQGMLPTLLARRLPYFESPGIAIMVTQAVTLSMVLYGDFSAVLAVDMLLYCLSLLLEIASIIHLRQSQPDLERAYKIPADGFLLFIFFVPSIAICFIVFASGSLQDWGVTGIFLLAGVALIWLIEWSQDHYPDSYTGVEEVLHVGHEDEARVNGIVVSTSEYEDVGYQQRALVSPA